MVEPTDPQTDGALERGRAAQRHEPRATSVGYDRQTRRMIVELTNGCSLAFSPKLTQG